MLNACSDGSDSPDAQIESVSSYIPTLFISFKDGPNAGRHPYVVDGNPGSKVQLEYNPDTNVTLLDLRGLVAVEGDLRIDELTRFNSGELVLGANRASTWRSESANNNKQCGVLNLRDHENTQIYKNGFGRYSQCGTTTIDLVTDWRNSEDSVTKVRVIKGSFSDRVRFQVSMDSQAFKRFETEVTVEFDMLQKTARLLK
ncbi:MAG: hypothetical protein ACJAQ6_001522 [Arenicella sp.]|jgi:hypothetical protein